MLWLKTITHSVLGLVLVTSLYYVPKPKIIELLYDYRPYVFIHIPKTGGSALKRWIQTSKCPYIGKVIHEETAHSTLLFGQQPIAIIRHPVDRFISNYYYWKYGSEDIKEWRRSDDWHRADQIKDIHEFIDILRNNQHPLHLSTKRHINSRDHYTWLHFLAQSYWIGEHEQETHLICYNQTYLERNVQQTLDNLGIPCQVELKKVNTSMHKAKERFVLSDKEKAWIAQEYPQDTKLWTRHCLSNQR